MVFLRIFVLSLFFVLSLAVPHSYIDRDEQRFIDHLLLNSKRAEKASAPSHHLREEEEDELEREGVPVVNQEVMKRARQTQNSKEFQLIKKAALAVVKRLSMPSPPKEGALIDKAVLFVLRRTLPGEYAKIRGGIKEQVDKMIFSNRSKQDSVKPNQKVPGLREEKILVALEDILSELAVQLNLTTLQIKFLVNSTVNVLAKYFGLNPWQNHELHERITSHVRAKLNYEDLDNKDARLRRLEENIEQDILHLKLTNNQAKRLEALMIEEEAVREGLSKSERLRMLKRVFADIKDDFKTELQEQESAPPKLSSVNIISIKNLIKQKALEMQLTKKELKVLALAILTAIEDLTMHTSPTPQGTQPTHATSMFKKTSPFTIKETEEPISRAPTPTKADELEEELEGTRHPSTSHSQEYKTTPSEHHTSSPHKEHVKTPTTASTVTGTAKVEHSTRMSTEMNGKSADDLVSKLAQDEAELEEKDFHPIAKTEAKDDLELEQEAKTQLVKKTKTITEYKPTKPISMPVKTKPTKKVTESTAVTEDKKLENHVTKPIISHTIEATKPKTAKQSTLKATKKHTFEVTRPRTGSTLKHTHKPIATEIGKPKPTEKFMLTTDRANEEEDLLEGRVTKPTNGHDVTLLKTEHLIKTTLISSKANREKATDEAKHSVSPTEKINKEIEEDLLEGRVTKPTKGQAVDITQLKTKANREKPTSEANPSVSPTKERNKEIEEDLLEGRNTMPKHGGTVHVSQPKTEEHVTKPTPNPDQQTEIRHTTFKHITTPITQAPGVDEESNRISKKGVLSRRHRVGIMDDDKELEDLGGKMNDKKEDDTSLENDLTLLGRPHKNDRKKDEASLEDDLSLLGRPHKNVRKKDEASLEDDLSLLGRSHKDKSLENDLNEILAQKEAIHDESLEDELKDLSLG